MEWMLLPFRRYFDFTGRSRRMEFWMFQLLYIGVTVVFGGIMLAGIPWSEMQPGGAMNTGAPADPNDPFAVFALFGPLFWIGLALMAIWWLACFIPAMALTVRRLHDRGMSGWWYGGLLILSFIPIISVLSFFGYIALIVVMFLPSEEGMNKWGDNPKNPVQANVFA